MGSDVIQRMAGEEGFAENYEEMKRAVMDVVGTHFRPEFINRIDDTVVFRPLGKAEIRQIATLQLGILNKRLEENELHIEFTDSALDLLGEEGFDPVYGARPLKRAIQSELENPLAQKLLAGEFAPGDTIFVDTKDGKLVFGNQTLH